MSIAIYARVSTQRPAQAQPIEQQRERLARHVADQGWAVLDKHRFRDDGYSGASLRRPGLERLRDAVAAGEVDRVLLTAPDRLARNDVHQALLLDELGRGGCVVEFLDRPMSEDPNDQVLLQIRGAVAEYERSVIAERMRRGRQAKLRAGLLLPWTRALACPPRYNLHTYTVDWERGIANLATTGGRQRIPFTVPDFCQTYGGRPTRTADLIERGGRWWLHIVVDVPAPIVTPVDDVVGVDLGIAQPAVTSNNHFVGQKAWRNREARLFKLRRALQAKGTKSARRHLTRLRGKHQRFRRDCDHVLSKRIVQATPPGGTIAVENLTNIRARVKTRTGKHARRIHGWSFDQCRQFITYKAEERGCMVVGVDPRHTSQTCPVCGHVARNNRRSRALFICRQCGYTLYADLVGSRNIAAKYLASVGRPDAGAPPVNRRIVGEPPGSAHKLSPVGDSR